MKKSEPLTVDDVFMIDQLGLVVVPDFSVSNNEWRPSNETVTILRPDGTRFDAVAQFNHSHFNIPDPSVSIDRRWRVTICILDFEKDEIPIGSVLFVRSELADQLQDKQA